MLQRRPRYLGGVQRGGAPLHLCGTGWTCVRPHPGAGGAGGGEKEALQVLYHEQAASPCAPACVLTSQRGEHSLHSARSVLLPCQYFLGECRVFSWSLWAIALPKRLRSLFSSLWTSTLFQSTYSRPSNELRTSLNNFQFASEIVLQFLFSF